MRRRNSALLGVGGGESEPGDWLPAESDIDVHSYPGWDRELVRTSDELLKPHSKDAYVAAVQEKGRHSASSRSGHLHRGTQAVNYDARNKEFVSENDAGYAAPGSNAFARRVTAEEAEVDHFYSSINPHSHAGYDGQDITPTSIADYHKPPKDIYSSVHHADAVHLRPGTQAINYEAGASIPSPEYNAAFPGYWK